MGLFIGNNSDSGITLQIDGGFTTSEGYCHIVDYYTVKDRNNIRISLTLFKSKADRENNENPINCSKIENHYTIPCTFEELAEGDIFEIFYGKLKSKLETIDDWAGKIINDI